MQKISESFENEEEKYVLNYFPEQKSKLIVKRKINSITESLSDLKIKLSSGHLQGYQNHSFHWFLDNLYIIEEQISILKRDFPQKFCNKLPQIEVGKEKGYPRIYIIAKKHVHFFNGKIDLNDLEESIKKRQEESDLTIGEIWAIPICLRISLLEELVNELKRALKRAEETRAADHTAECIFEITSKDVYEKELNSYLEKELSKKTHLGPTYIVELITKLKDQDSSLQEISNIFSKMTKLTETDLQKIFQKEHIEQAKNQIAISNIVNGLRIITKMEWHPFFERINNVDNIFKNDPTGNYSKMDKATKDSYRNTIETISRIGKINETIITQMCLDLAKTNKKHTGYYLVGEGKEILKQKFSIKAPPLSKLKKYIENSPGILYFSLFLFFFIVTFFFLYQQFDKMEISNTLRLTILALSLIPISEFSIGIVHTIITQVRRPKTIPKMDFREGVPEDHKTMVVIPCLLISKKVIDDLIQKLELHYLSNKDNNIFFGLLGDPVDHENEIKEDDKELIEYTKKRIANLNGRHKGEERFFFYFRKRVWNKYEDTWMAYERKRGKISEFNQLIRGSRNTTFVEENINWNLLNNLKYIITLDADTQLPINAAKKLIGTIAHPLNYPIFSDTDKKITSGYAIIQPRISVSMISSVQTRFAQIFSGNTGLDPYTTAISDVYQDLFSEGNYTGKGLYHIDAFEKILEDVIPDNKILSHDLFEGCLARTALTTDIELYDDYPENFTIFSKRNHRWIRGDWQLMSWLGKNVKDKNLLKIKNPISLIGRWKIFDNLRRSLVAPVTLLLLSLIWTLKPLNPMTFSLGIIVFVNSSLLLSSFIDLIKFKKIKINEHLRNNIFLLRNKTEQLFLMIVYLPEMALVNTDAILRALYRTFISKKKRLEWVTFSQIQTGQKNWKDLISFGPLVSFILFFLIYFLKPESLIVAFPFFMTWLITPYITFGTQRKIPPKYKDLSKGEINDFNRYARLTWHFFEIFVNEEGNWLAPDNYQEDPRPQIAFRTSPTNIGLQLLSNLAAYDLKFISLSDFLNRTEKTMKSLQRLEKRNGHFYNWYDTKTLEPLNPKYVSTVDSGNLAGYLITLKQGVLDLANNFRSNQLKINTSGIEITIKIIIEKLEKLGIGNQSCLKKMWYQLESMVQNIETTAIEVLYEKAKSIKKFSEEIECEERFKTQEELKDLCECLMVQCEGFVQDTLLVESSTRLRLKSIAYQAHELAYKMDFKFLFDFEKMIFSIGHKDNEITKDSSYYDLLASESRLASYFAIAKGDIPDEHWFRLGRQMVQTSKNRVLVSWSATMFEYLMPLLVMRRFEDTLLDHTYESIVKSQIKFGDEKKIPWGISESGYNARDLQYNYQYAAFGIPEVGLKNTIPENIVVSPYSTMLAAMIAPQESLQNLKNLEKIEILGSYGFYESIDYTPSRIPKDKNFIILNSFMAHHQGMSLLSINNLINNQVMQKRFHSENSIESSQILLQERSPISVEIKKFKSENGASIDFLNKTPKDIKRKMTSKEDLYFETQTLSNGKLSLMTTGAGRGYLKLENTFLGKWDAQDADSPFGQLILIKEKGRNKLFSLGKSIDSEDLLKSAVTFSEENATFTLEDKEMMIESKIIISGEDNVEIRKITLTNKMGEAKDIELTTYQEITLCSPKTYNMHPAFNNLFIKTKFNKDFNAIIGIRNENEGKKKKIGFQFVLFENTNLKIDSFESDRSKLISRSQQTEELSHVLEKSVFTKSTGAVLDPVFAFKKEFLVDGRSVKEFYLITGMTEEEDEALELIGKYQRKSYFEREFALSWVTSQNTLQHLKIDEEKAIFYQKLCGHLFIHHEIKPIQKKQIETSFLSIEDLWSLGISGDIPILTLRIKTEKDLRLLRDLIHAHEYIRLKGHIFDFVIINEENSGYLQKLHDEIMRQIIICGGFNYLNKDGGIFIINPQIIGKPKTDLLLMVSSMTFIASAGSLSAQILRFEKYKKKHLSKQSIKPKRKKIVKNGKTTSNFMNHIKTELPNSFGGFEKDGASYLIKTNNYLTPPSPWINVICNNPNFGFQVSDSGQGFTWALNSRQNRITKWSNDPLVENISEAIYLKDEESDLVWSPTPSPLKHDVNYFVRHEAGLSSFFLEFDGIEHTLEMFSPIDSSFKILKLCLKNSMQTKKMLTIGFFVDFQLSAPDALIRPILTTWDDSNQVLVAQNKFHKDFSDQITYLASSLEIGSYSSLPTLGHISSRMELDTLDNKNIIFLLGQTDQLGHIQEIKKNYFEDKNIEQSLVDVKRFWEDILSKITIETPSKELNYLFNHWLLYQTLSCRVWARSAFYQSGGAYGFRDQLQDVMSVIYSKPNITKEHILLAAGRQFTDGDVQHWWHPPTGQGIRTKFSDDLLWLPFVVAFYVEITKDFEILQINIPFLKGIDIPEGHDEIYFNPEVSNESATLYEHCLRAIKRSLKTGEHGLPLIGSGDWNDGMNKVGNKGSGESVWVSWFLMSTINNFLFLCEFQKDNHHLELFKNHVLKLKNATEENAWDGDWYLRAFYDNGDKMGSKENDECQIDSIAQSWSALSDCGEKKRSKKALDSAYNRLVDFENKIIKLFDPPFEKTKQDPGYIKNYLPGVRENGGQYTHAGIWLMMAFAEIGDSEKVWKLLQILNPINHSHDEKSANLYKLEPYVVAADIYGADPHKGRGGWSWYTGSSGWLYRAILESFIGLKLRGNILSFHPCLPKEWESIKVQYKFGKSIYQIKMINSLENISVSIDGQIHSESHIHLTDEERNYEVIIRTPFSKEKEQ